MKYTWLILLACSCLHAAEGKAPPAEVVVLDGKLVLKSSLKNPVEAAPVVERSGAPMCVT